MSLAKEYENFLADQTHVAPLTLKVMRTTLERFPSPDRLDAKWFRKRMKSVRPATVKGEIKLAKQVLTFLDQDTDELSHVKIPRAEFTVTVEDLYTKDELTAIFSSCHETRDRAMLEVLFESATRAREFLSMTFENLTLNDDKTATVIVRGKTGTRQVPIFESVPALIAWCNVHPVGKGAIWTELRSPHRSLTYSGLYQLVKKKVKAARLKRPKRKLVHMFRHTRITELVKLGVRGQMLSKLVGWTKSSNMESVYVHLSTADVENEVRAKVFGLGPEEKEPEPLLKSTICPRCKSKNDQEARVCPECGLPLSNDAIIAVIEQGERDITHLRESVIQEILGDSDGLRSIIREELQAILEELRGPKA
jgi:integrase/recombinase XerD